MHIIFTSSGFPYKISAANEKFRLIAKGLVENHINVTILTNHFHVKEKQHAEGLVDGIHYKILIPQKHEKVSKITKYIGFIRGLCHEAIYLKRLKKKENEVIYIVSYINFLLFLYYVVLFKILNIKLIISIMEWHISTTKGMSLWKRINALLFDRQSFKYSIAALPISHYIENEIKPHQNIRTLKIPILVDNEYFDSISCKKIVNPYFLYCGSVGYYAVVRFVIKAYSIYLSKENNNPVRLTLILNGNVKDINKIKEYINNNDISDKVKILHSLSYAHLVRLYKNATALLAPLRETTQDKARFPHKIGEYLASARPIISNKWGEVGLIFRDQVTALLANNYSEEEFAKHLLFASQNKKLVDRIGLNGKKLCLEKFNYKIYGKLLADFLKDLSNH